MCKNSGLRKESLSDESVDGKTETYGVVLLAPSCPLENVLHLPPEKVAQPQVLRRPCFSVRARRERNATKLVDVQKCENAKSLPRSCTTICCPVLQNLCLFL